MGRILLHPTATALAAQVLDLITTEPANTESLASATGAPVEAVRSIIAALWTADRVAPFGDDEWVAL